jgi:hypothetical protein
MLPLLCHNLKKTAPEAIPPAIRLRAAEEVPPQSPSVRSADKRLLRILDIFEAEGIAAIPFKVPALADQVYGDIGLRTYVDLDILVHKEDVLRAKAVLLKEGYRPEVLLNPRQEELFLRSECEYNFNHEARIVRVEVHWRINPSCYCINFDAIDIWQHLGTLALQSKAVPALSPEDLLIFLCIHGARHNWAELKQICDLAGHIEIHEDLLDWKGLMDYARGQHIERILLLGLLLGNRLMEIRAASGCLKRRW